MKKLLMLLGTTLVLLFSVGNASAISFGLDIGADGSIDDPAEITIWPFETVEIDIYLLDWDDASTVPLGAIDYQFGWDSTKVSVTSVIAKDIKPNGYWLWDDEAHFPDGDYVDLSLIEFGVGVTGNMIRLHTVILHSIAEGDAAIGVGNGYLVDTNGYEGNTADPAAGVIHTACCCACVVKAADDGIVTDGEPTEQYNVITISAPYCTPNDYVFSDECMGGDVDPVTGLFIATVPIPCDETCTITVNDSLNPGVECTAEVYLAGW